MGLLADLTDEQVDERAKAAVRLALEKQKALGIPIVYYDPSARKIYQQMPDGTKVEVTEAIMEEHNAADKG